MRVRFPLSQLKSLKLFLYFSILYVLIFSLGVAGKADYVAFATDYDNYGAIYSCQSILFGHRRSASILSRTQTLSPMYITKVSPSNINLLYKKNIFLYNLFINLIINYCP